MSDETKTWVVLYWRGINVIRGGSPKRIHRGETIELTDEHAASFDEGMITTLEAWSAMHVSEEAVEEAKAEVAATKKRARRPKAKPKDTEEEKE